MHAYKIYKPDIEGGIPEIISTLTARNSASGFQNSILTTRKRGLSRSYLVNEIPVRSVLSAGNAFSMPISPSYPLAFLAHARQADIVIHHAPFPLSDIAIAANFPNHVGLIIFWHAEVVGRAFMRQMIGPFIKLSLRRADRIVVAHQAMAERSEVLAPFRNKISIVPFGTDVGFWQADLEETAAQVQLRVERYPRLVVFVGRLVGYKGLDILLQAIKRTNASLMIVGTGVLREDLEQQAHNLGISERVTFAGKISREEVRNLLRAARALILPSVTIAEAFGLVQMEAMAAGCPVINTSLPTAVPDVARHEREGLTVPPCDVDALARAIQAIIDDPVLRGRLSANAKARASREYDADVFRSRMAAVYNDVLRSRNKQ